jgi:hypothetical protein
MCVFNRLKVSPLAVMTLVWVSASAYELTAFNYTIPLNCTYAWLQYQQEASAAESSGWELISNTGDGGLSTFTPTTHNKDGESFTFSFFGSAFCVYGEGSKHGEPGAYEWEKEFTRSSNISMTSTGESWCGSLSDNGNHRIEVYGITSIFNITITTAIPAPPK